MDLKLFFNEAVKRGLVQLVRRKIYYIMMVVAPLLCSLFLLSLMDGGSVTRVPVGVVDLDQSSLSRNIERNLAAMQGVHIIKHYDTYASAEAAVQSGEILGFFLMPADLERSALNAESPKVSYYINYAYFSPASSQYRGFKTVSVLANGGIVKTVLDATGLIDSETTSNILQPIVAHTHALNNPWANYSYYLNASFVPCFLALFILLITSFSIGTELKYGTCREWIDSAGGSMGFAIFGKMWPHTLIFTITGWTIQLIMYRIYGMPLNCNPWHMIIAMFLFVLANQAFALLMMCIVPNFRYGATLCTLFGMLSFSFCAFSMPGETLYPWVNAIGYIMPVRHFFSISIDQALNGIDLYYSRVSYAALIMYPMLPLPLLGRLKHECLNPIYI